MPTMRWVCWVSAGQWVEPDGSDARSVVVREKPFFRVMRSGSWTVVDGCTDASDNKKSSGHYEGRKKARRFVRIKEYHNQEESHGNEE